MIVSIALAAAPLATAPAEQPVWPADAMVLVVAGWCAPCHAEIARIDEVARAAGGRRVVVVGLDATAGTQALLARLPAGRRWEPSPVQRRRLREAVYAASAGLPYAVVTDADGRVCAEAMRALDADHARALVRSCARPQAAP